MNEDYYQKHNEEKYDDELWMVIDRSNNKWFAKYVKDVILKRWVSKLKKKDSLLDAGGGTGNYAYCFKNDFKKIVVLDVSKKVLDRIPEKEFIKIEGSLLEIPLKDESFDCILLIDVFEHIAPEHLEKLMSELKRVLTKHGRILIYSSEYGYAIGLIWKRILGKKDRLTKSDHFDGHLNRLTFSEVKNLVKKTGLVIDDYYHYAIFFQQITDFLKDSFSKIISSLRGVRKKEGYKKGQHTKESLKTRENLPIIKQILFVFSFISYLDIVFFGKWLPGASRFLNLKKR